MLTLAWVVFFFLVVTSAIKVTVFFWRVWRN